VRGSRVILDDLKRIHTFDKYDALGAAIRQLNSSAVELLRLAYQTWLPEVPTTRNAAKQLAQELMGRTVVLQSQTELQPAAQHWRDVLQQNGTHISPAVNDDRQPYAVIVLQSNLESEPLHSHGPEPLVVMAQGTTLSEQQQWILLFGTFVSIYLAILHGRVPNII
jgi:hypothetical protein